MIGLMTMNERLYKNIRTAILTDGEWSGSSCENGIYYNIIREDGEYLGHVWTNEKDACSEPSRIVGECHKQLISLGLRLPERVEIEHNEDGEPFFYWGEIEVLLSECVRNEDDTASYCLSNAAGLKISDIEYGANDTLLVQYIG